MPEDTVQQKPDHAFLPDHLDYLRQRAIDPAVAYREGVRSLDEAGVHKYTGNVVVVGGGLAQPYGPPLPEGWPSYCRVQLDERDVNNKKAVVETGNGRDVPMYLLTTTTTAVASSLVIVENAFKALSLASNGWPDVMGLGGVDAGFFTKGATQVQPHLTPFFPAGRTVIIAMDAGQAVNPAVAYAGAKIARALLDRGVRAMLACVPLNRGSDQGPDDLIAARGAVAFAEVLAGARPACPVEYAKLLASDPSRGRSALEDLPFCAALHLGGPAAQKAVAKILCDLHEPKQIKDAFANHKAVRAWRAKSKGAGPVVGSGAAWEKGLLRSNSGEILSCTANVQLVLENDPHWAGTLAFNLLLNDIVFTRPPLGKAATDFLKHVPGSRWVDEDDVSLSVWLHRAWSIDFAFQKLRPVVALAAHRGEFCPIQRHLSEVSWDGTPRVEAWLNTYLGVADTAYARKAGACWIVSAVARIFEPGCQVDYVLVLEGPQRTGKSTAIQELAMSLDFYTDQIRDVGAAECEKLLEGKWIVELGELAATARAELEKTKAFITSRTSRYRPSYGRSVRDFPRRCIFIGTVNPVSGHGYLKDPTGNMRFWPVKTGVAHAIDRAGIRADAEQLWAEAVHLYLTGFKWYPSLAEMEASFVPEQEDRREVDPWEAPIRRYVRSQVPEETDRKSRSGIERKPGYVTSETLMKDALGLDLQRHDALAQKRVAQIMHTLGWETDRVRDNDSRFRAWIRTARAEGSNAAPEGANGSSGTPSVVDYDGEVRLPDGERVRLLS